MKVVRSCCAAPVSGPMSMAASILPTGPPIRLSMGPRNTIAPKTGLSLGANALNISAKTALPAFPHWRSRMSDLSKLPVTVITGFLGSGKTTLISQLMQNPQGKRLAVIVNEFGDVGVDGDILKSCAIPDCPAENIMELANGCICCTVADDFIPTIEALMALDPRPEHILIETSGLALRILHQLADQCCFSRT